MKNILISLLIVFSIALQSFASVADLNESHQVDTQHILTEHSHEIDDLAVVSEGSDPEHSIDDCHHCGHCQGSHTQWFTSKKSSATFAEFLVINQYFHLNQYPKNFIEEHLRPPIA